MNCLYILILFFSIITCTNSHARWKCPSSRDELDDKGEHISFSNTGNKIAACGPKSGVWGYGRVTTLFPGWTTFSWEESVSHHGSPFRLAILDSNETAIVLLLDHIPHSDESNPVPYVEKSYVEYKISVEIPDIKCDKCSLQLLYIMTDKSVKCGLDICYYNPYDAACKGSTDERKPTCFGAPNNNPCKSENVCFSNYHSCTDVIIKGSIEIDKFQFNQQPEDWPYSNKSISYYGLESGTWAKGWLRGIPEKYITQYDSLIC